MVREQQNLAALMAIIVNSAQSITGMFSKRRPKAVKPEDFLSKDFQRLVSEIFGEAQGAEDDWASLIDDAKEKGLKGPW